MRQYYPNETKGLKTIEAVIEFGLKMAFEYAQHMKYCDMPKKEVILDK